MTEETEEQYKRRIQDAKEAHRNRRNFIDFANQSAIELTSHAIKAFLLINGGAAVAMLGFVASVSGDGGKLNLEISGIVQALMWFAYGAGAAALCAGLAYCVLYLQVAQASSAQFTWKHPYVVNEPVEKWWAVLSGCLHVIAVVVAIGSLTCFGMGVASVSSAILNSL